MFGTSGIRGIYGRDVTEELALKVANVFAGKKLVLARDIRASGISLSHAVAAGALSAGSDVIDLGIVPTPTAALATKKYGCRGIMITASHNPPEYNGLKLIEDGKEIGKALEKEVTEAYGKAQRLAARAGTVLHDSGIIDEHKKLVSVSVDSELIKKKKPKVIIDCNGAGSVITPYLLTDLGCQVTTINSSLEGFGRASEPNEKNLTVLSKLMGAGEFDFGIAHDGDGDRCVIVDDTGAVLPLDVQLAIMIEHELEISKNKTKKTGELEKITKQKNKKIVSTVEASLAIRDVVESAGGEIEITPVGSTFVAEAVEAGGAVFGGEPCGEYVYRDGVHMPDAVLAAAKFAEIFCMKGKFSKLKTRYKQNFMAREKFPARDKHATVEKIKKSLSVHGKVRSDDGIRVDEEDGWFLIRASGTEPIVRLTMEYKTKNKLEQRKNEMTKLIKANL